MAEARLHDCSSFELRAAPRISLMLRAAKLIAPAGEFLCILRDVSATGLKARLFHALPADGPYEIEVGTGERHPIEPVWQDDRHAGFRFIRHPIDLAALIEEDGQFPRRQVRLALDLPIMLGVGGIRQSARLRNLSQHGALIELDGSSEPLALRQPVQLRGQQFPLRQARVRWRGGQAHGLVFLDGFLLDELAVLVARLQNGARTPGSDPRINY